MSNRKAYVITGYDLKVIGRDGLQPPDSGPEEIDNPNPPDRDRPPLPEYGEEINVGVPKIKSAPGLWIGPTLANPVIPVPDDEYNEFPAGAIWPKPYGYVKGNFIALAYFPGHGWKYVVIDPDAWPNWESAVPEPPIYDNPDNPDVPDRRPPSPDSPDVPDRRPPAPSPEKK